MLFGEIRMFLRADSRENAFEDVLITNNEISKSAERWGILKRR